MNTVKIKDTEHFITFNLNALRKFCKKTSMELGDVGNIFITDKDNPLTIERMEQICELVICGLDEGARINRVEHDVTIDDVFVKIGEENDFLSQVIGIYVESLPQKKTKLTTSPNQDKSE